MDLSPGRVMAPAIAEAGEMRCCMSLCFYANHFQKSAANLFHLRVGQAKERTFHQAAVVDGAHLIHQQIRWLWKAPGSYNPDTQRLGILYEFRRERNHQSGGMSRIQQSLRLDDQNRTSLAGLSAVRRVQIGEPDLTALKHRDRSRWPRTRR